MFLAVFAIAALHAQGQMRLSAKYLNYIDQYKEAAIAQQAEHGIPASITLAQGLLESQAGESRLATVGNNHFGIKCNGWQGDTIRHDDDQLQECFRSYDSAMQSYADHSLFLKRKRYEPLFELEITDYKAWAKTLKKCGYATDPAYPDKLINIIETYELYQYDDSACQQLLADATPQPATEATTDNLLQEEEYTDMDIAEEIGSMLIVKRLFGLYYVRARKGDTLKSISKELDVSEKKLAKFNDVDTKHTLSSGEIVWIEQKAKKSASAAQHTVNNGDTLHSISQQYGIQLKSLASLNNMPIDAELNIGDIIVLQ